MTQSRRRETLEMRKVETLDVKGMAHEEREKLIFRGIEDLKEGESLRLVLEFNPLPLTHLLEARGEFELHYEKQGPTEWILNIQRTVVMEDRKEQLRQFLKEPKQGQMSEDSEVKAKEIFRSVDAKTLGVVEQELIREGVSHEEIRKSLCDIHLDVLKETLVSKRIDVSAPHPVHTLMEEHRIILDSLNQLDSVIDRLKRMDSFDRLGEDEEKLKELAHHLIEAESHHSREEEVLFPKLEKHGIIEPAEIMKMDHVEFKKRKQELYQTVYNPERMGFKDYKKKVIELGSYLSSELESHIFKEDNILYQIALQVLTEEDWDEVKAECDRIGYCCFTPKDLE